MRKTIELLLRWEWGVGKVSYIWDFVVAGVGVDTQLAWGWRGFWKMIEKCIWWALIVQISEVDGISSSSSLFELSRVAIERMEKWRVVMVYLGWGRIWIRPQKLVIGGFWHGWMHHDRGYEGGCVLFLLS